MDIIELIFQGQLYFVNYKQLEDTKKKDQLVNFQSANIINYIQQYMGNNKMVLIY